MTKKEEIEKKVEELITDIIVQKDFELVDTEFIKEGSDYYLRVYIDKPGGITIDDCEAVSREFNDVLDTMIMIEVPYIFEVSSPGLTRLLKKDKDFFRSLGKRVELKTFEKINGITEFEGTLQEYKDGTVIINTDDNNELSFDKKKLAFIRLAYVEEEK